jgi:hypothetical protein
VKPNALVINESDNVAVTLEDIKQGQSAYLADGRELVAASDIPFSHKIALRRFERGEDIIKYGEVIGQAGEDIGAGDWVHTHNLVIED